MSKALKICFVMLLVAATSQAAVFKVKEGGSAPYFTNLDTALWTATTYGGGPHQIEIYAGTYTTDIDLVVPSNVDAITGVEAGVLFQNPTPPTNITNPLVDNFLDVAGSNGLTISGLHVKGYLGGIVTKGAMAVDLTVEDCVFEDCIVGVYVGANGGLFDNLEIFGGWMGIGINSLFAGENIDNNTIQNCTIHGIRRAPAIAIDADEDFFVAGAANAALTIDGNQILDCIVYECDDHAIMLAGATNTTVDGGEVYDVGFAGITCYGAAGGTIENTKIHQVAQSTINADSTLLTWGGVYGAIAFNGTTGFTIDKVTVWDNGGLGTMGGGTAFGEYAVSLSGGSTGNTVQNSCFFDHAGVQGEDNADGSNVWAGNYYPNPTGPYLLDGSAGEVDATPNTFNASANADPITYQVWDEFDMTFDWSLPNCDPVDNVGLASYEFTVTFDPTKLEYVSGDYNYDFLGDTAFYAPIDAQPGLITFGAANFLAPGYGNATMAFGHFKVIGFGSATVTLASTYLDSLNNPILVNNTPLVLTLTDTQRPTITVVGNDPVPGTDTYSDFFPLSISGVVTDNFMLSTVWYRFDDAGGWNYFEAVTGMYDTYGPYVPSIAALSQGAHKINVIVLDAAGNRDSAYYNFTIDRTAPAATAIVMSDPNCAVDPQYTNEATVNVAITDDGSADIAEMEFYLTGYEGFVAYDPTTTYTLPAVDGAYTLYVHLKDKFGNVSGAWPSDVITLDQVGTAPTTQWIVTNPTPTYTTTAAVVADASFSYPTNYQYVITVDPADLDCNSGKWAVLPDAANRPVALTLPVEGVNTVYFAGRDLAGNISSVTQTIKLDTDEPEFLTFTMPACAKVVNPPANFTWNPAANPDVKWIHLGLTAGGPYTQHVDVSAMDPSNASVTTGLWEATHTVYAVLEDNAGNVGPEVNAVVKVDLTAPTAGVPRINANAAWTNSATVTVAWTTLPAADAIEARFTQVAGDYSLPQNAWQTLVTGGMPYTFSPVTEDVNSNLYVQVRDCAGNISTEVLDAIRIDLTAPVIGGVSINGGAVWTNSKTVAVGVTKTELRPYQVFISEQPDMTGATMYPYGTGGPYTPFLLTGDDDVSKPVYVQMSDLAGNMSNILTDDIGLDTHAPTGSFVLVQTSNPMAAPGYTNSTTVDIKNITYDDDVTDMGFQNSDGSGNLGWLPPDDENLNWTLIPGVDGQRIVQLALRDAAGNVMAWTVADTIILDTQAPLTGPTGFTVTPTGSCDLNWTADPNDQYYFFRYNASFEYPTFESGVPPAPALDEGFFGAYVFGPNYHFDADDYPEMDMLSFSLWTVDKAGNTSAAPATAVGVNYVPGDFNWNNELEILEFGDIAAAYMTNPNTKDWADIATLVTEDPLGLPDPDGMVDFPDLNKFAQNYVGYGDFGSGAKAAELAPVAISAEYPGYMPEGTEYTFSLKADNPASVLTYHLVFDLDETNFAIVSVEPGSMYEDGMKAFFFHNQDSKNLEIDGAVFGDVFEGQEVAQVTVRAINSASFDLSGSELVVRGVGNQAVEVSFSGVRKEGLLPLSFALHQNYPNPFNPTTTISFDVPKATQYTLTIYNLTGQEIASFNGMAEAGVATVEWNAEGVASGVYFYRLEAETFTASKKMVLLK